MEEQKKASNQGTVPPQAIGKSNLVEQEGERDDVDEDADEDKI